MARKAAAAPVEIETDEVVVSARVRKLIDAERPRFMNYVQAFGVMSVSRERVAPGFMRAYRAFEKDTDGGSFVAFVRLLDPTVGEEYRDHRTYRSADYLRKLANGGAERRRAKTKEHGPPIATPLNGLARLASTILNLVSPDQRPRLWELFSEELGWTAEQVERLQKRVEHVDPLITVRPTRGASMPALKVTAPPHIHTAAA